MFDLKNRLILLTGASGHLGRAMARGIAAAGGSPVLVGRDLKSLEETQSEITGKDIQSFVLPADLSDPSAVERLIEELGDKIGRLHGIVNNAYNGRVGSITKVTTDDFLNAAQLNLSAPFQLIKGLYPLLKNGANESGKSSSIVNVCSMYAKVSPYADLYSATGTEPNPAHYGAAKAGLLQLTRYLACHLDPASIRVNSISPGAFPNVVKGNARHEFLEALTRRVPMQRLGRPEELVGPLLFLLSEASSYVTGADLAVDGGWTAW